MDRPLTNRQLEIVVLVANGYRHDEIAKKLYLSKSSVGQQLSTAQKSAGARTLPHLVSIVIASGILEWTDNERSITPRT
jgi:DNA-binding NarL/FixJ family response regulator